ncbi:MAG TPA: ThuA domain-containing protein [Vicinamibacterales bacterium]|nr:ThuA domain-containing protein [Vicinamibacterales bacterium]
MKTKLTLAALFGVCMATLVAQQNPAPSFPRASDALERVTWRTRTLVANDRLTNWDVAIPGMGLTFLESVVRADAALVPFVEASNTQRVSTQVQKNLDHNLTAAEIAAVREAMGQNVRVGAYRVDSMPADPATRRRILEFARALGATTIVVPGNTDYAGLDTLAEEFRVTVAVMNGSAETVKTMEGRSVRLGVGIDTGQWAQDGTNVRDGVARVKDRLLYVNLRDRSGRGANAQNVPLGKGVANLREFFTELERQDDRQISTRQGGDGSPVTTTRVPIAMTIDTTGVVKAPGDIFTAVAAFEDAVQPAYATNFNEYSRTRPIRFDVVTPSRGETLTPADIDKRAADIRARIDAAVPNKPIAAPKKARRLLVIESLEGMSHNTIPLTNVMIQRMGEKTGAWTTVFSNDLNNLRYPKIKEYDAVFLNSIVGEFLPDPSMRADLVRYVNEGGGMGGIHGTPWASRNWDEFAEMIGAQSAPHRIENGVLKVYDKENPIVRPFNYEDMPFREEYYRFEDTGNGRLRWDKVRVLLVVDLDEKVPSSTDKPWTGYKRPDKVYPVAWIREYGKGRVFYNSMGHMNETFMKPEIVGHFLAGMQYILGDIEANATPNPLK